MATVLLIVIYTAFIGLGIPDSLFGTAWPAIYPDLGVPVSFASFFSVLCSCGTVISSLLSGAMIRRFGTEKVTAASTVLTALGLLGCALSGNFWLLCLCAIPLGLGAGTVDTALNNYVALHYNATHMSFLHCFYGVGVALSPYLMSFALAQANNWRGGYRTMFCIQSAIALLLLLSLPVWKKVERKREEPEEECHPVPVRQILKLPVARATLLVFIGSCALESMCLGWGSTYLVSSRGMDAAGAAAMITFYYVGMTLGRFLSGVVSKWLSARKIIVIGEAVTLAAVVLLFLPLPAVAAGVALFLVGLGNGPVFPNMTYLTPIHFGKDVCQSFIGLQLASAYTAFMLTPITFSLIAQNVGVGLFPVVCLAAFVLAAGATVAVLYGTRKEKTHE